MHLILCHRPIHVAKPPQLPHGKFVFACFENFSVGPLQNWGNSVEFQKNRSDFWTKTSKLDLPDGAKMDYFVWLQELPRHDPVKWSQGGGEVTDIPETYECDELLPQAAKIEIWADHTVSGYAFLWYVIATLEDVGVDRGCVTLSCIPDFIGDRQSSKFWTDMLLDHPERGILANTLSETEWRLMLRSWNAITQLPEGPDPELIKDMDEKTLRVFDILRGRYADPESGLTNVQMRLLCTVRKEWLKMTRVLGDAICAGWDDLDPVGDAVLHTELEEMSRMAPPLVEMSGVGEMPNCRVRLTSAGESRKRFLLS